MNNKVNNGKYWEIGIGMSTHCAMWCGEDIEMDVEIKPFPLLMLPFDIQNFIATFLPFNDSEEEQQFIERTAHKKKAIPEKCSDHIPSFTLGTGLKTVSAYCPHNKTIALLIKLYNEVKATGTLMFIDRYNNQKICDIPLNYNHISTIAISRNRDMFAIIHEIEQCRSNAIEIMQYKSILLVKNINTHKEEIYDIPSNFAITNTPDHPKIDFNKQGTHIILRGYGREYDNPYYMPIPAAECPAHHIIFPLTVNTPNQNAKNKTLEKYFRQQGVCKELIKQITLNK